MSSSELNSSKKKVVSPIAQMVDRLRDAKYVATRDEMHVLMKCGNRMRKYGLEGFIAAGCAIWTVTGRLNLLQRLTATVVGAGTGGFLTTQLSIKPCMEDILSLEGSRFQEELVAILQKEHAHSTKVRELLQKYYYLEPLYDDKSQGMPSVTLRKRQSTWQVFNDSSLEVWGQEEDAKLLEHKSSEPSKSATSVEDSNLRIPAGHVKKNVVENELFADPVDMLAWTGSVEASKFEKKENASQRRRSRMSVIERREHNRMRYLLWKERQQQMQNEVSSFGY